MQFKKSSKNSKIKTIFLICQVDAVTGTPVFVDKKKHPFVQLMYGTSNTLADEKNIFYKFQI